MLEKGIVASSAVLLGLVVVSAACNGHRNAKQAPEPAPPSDAADAAEAAQPARIAPPILGIGQPATAEEIAVWDIDVRPDGRGLPPGSGTVAAGSKVYAARCAVCHGRTGVEGPNDRLVGRVEGDAFPFGTDPAEVETIGNYWPYATTIFDYIRRSMPYDTPGSLVADEVYGLTAYLLFLNEIVPEHAVIGPETLPAVRMPARDRFVPDDRRGGPEIR